MIDKKDIDAYLSIKAPDELRDRVLSEQTKKHNHIQPIVRVCYGLAAVFAVMIAVFVFYPSARADVYVDGSPIGDEGIVISQTQNPNARMMPMSAASEYPIPLKIQTKAKTSVAVNCGSIRLPDSNDTAESVTVSEDTELVWWFTPDGNDSYILTVKTKGKTDSYCISLNSQAQWVLTKNN